MGQESVAWVLAYVAVFGVSDTLVAICAAPSNPYLLFYYFLLAMLAFYILQRSHATSREHHVSRSALVHHCTSP